MDASGFQSGGLRCGLLGQRRSRLELGNGVESHHGPEHHLEESLQLQLRGPLLRGQNNEGDTVKVEKG